MVIGWLKALATMIGNLFEVWPPSPKKTEPRPPLRLIQPPEPVEYVLPKEDAQPTWETAQPRGAIPDPVKPEKKRVEPPRDSVGLAVDPGARVITLRAGWRFYQRAAARADAQQALTEWIRAFEAVLDSGVAPIELVTFRGALDVALVAAIDESLKRSVQALIAIMAINAVSDDAKRIIKIILSLFETGTFEPDYGSVTVLNDKHGITYGAHQSTDGGESSLDKIVARYVELGGIYAAALEAYAERLRLDATTASTPSNIEPWVVELMRLLERAGDEDPAMARAQEEVFELHYWQPALEQFLGMGLTTPLAMLVCYDSTIHSGREGIRRIRALFPEKPPKDGGDEQAWTLAYLRARRAWLMSIPRLQVTVYRIDSMLRLVEAGAWNLTPPVEVQKPRATVT